VVLGLAKKKYRVQVEGLEYQLEFYPSYVGLPNPPEGYMCTPSASPAPPPQASPTPALPVMARTNSRLSIDSAMLESSQAGGTAGGSVLLSSGGQHYMLVSSSLQTAATVVNPAISVTDDASTERQGTSSPPPLPKFARTGSMNSASSKTSGSNEAQSTEFREKYTEWVGHTLKIQRGKYQGRSAEILGLTNAKLQVTVPGVAHQLEYYPSMFQYPALPIPVRPSTSEVVKEGISCEV